MFTIKDVDFSDGLWLYSFCCCRSWNCCGGNKGQKKQGRSLIMRFLGNLIWILCGGLLSALGWWIVGILWCCTVVGIPFGKQFFKIARVALLPFGARVVRVHY